MPTPRVLVAAPLMEVGLSILKRYCEVREVGPVGRDQLLRLVSGFDAIVVRGFCRVDQQVIDCATQLKVIVTAGAGVQHIDTQYATAKGIQVFNVPGVNSDSVAELTVGLMIELVRRMHQANRDVRERALWDKTNYLGRELAGKTLGVLGLGRVGSAVARIAYAMRMNVVAFDPYVSHEQARRAGVELVSFDELLRRSDIISIHVPLTKETFHLIAHEQITKMKPGAYLINVSRGEVVDEDALVYGLASGKLAGVATDVVADEPRPGERISPRRLFEFDNFFITPHIGAWTVEAQNRVAIAVAHKVIGALGLAQGPGFPCERGTQEVI